MANLAQKMQKEAIQILLKTGWSNAKQTVRTAYLLGLRRPSNLIASISESWAIDQNEKQCPIRFVGVPINLHTTVEKMGVSCILVLLDGIVM